MAFKRYFIAIGVGAGLMYLFDPRQGRERREALSERIHEGREKAETAVESSRQALDQAHETTAPIRERATEVAHQTTDKLAAAKEKVTSAVHRSDSNGTSAEGASADELMSPR